MQFDDVPEALRKQCWDDCMCCPECSEKPCAGVMQGGLCDQMTCHCEEEPYGMADDDNWED